MKQLYFSIIIVMLSMTTMTINAKDRVYINDFSIIAGTSKTIEVILSNDTAYCALQTDIVLPEGLTIVTDDDEYVIDLTGRKARDHVVSTNVLADGSIRIFVTSQGSLNFSGNDGAILTIDITASSSFDKGNIIMRNSVLVEEDGTRHQFSDEITKVNGGIPMGIPGDVNGDGVVTAADVTALYDVMLNNDYTNVVNSDQTGDGVVTAADVTAVYDILLGN